MNRALRAATVGVLLFSPVALAACSAGQVTQTATQARDKTGAEGVVGDITLREVRLAYPDNGVYEAGSDATLVAVIANGGLTDDRLVSVTGPFRGVTFTAAGATSSPAETTSSAPATGTSSTPTATAPATGAAAGTTTESTGTAATTGSTASAGSTSASSTRGTSGSSATSTSSTPTTTTTTTAAPSTQAVSSSVDLPLGAGTNVLVGLQGGPQITLVGLQQQVTTADSVPVTFRFQNAGEVTVNAIVGNPTTVLPQGTPFNFDTGHGG